MLNAAYDRLQSALVGDNRRLAALAAAAVAVAAGVAIGGWIGLLNAPLALASILALTASLLMLRSTQLTLAALVGIVFLFPFAAVPMNIGFEPTFLDGALGILVFVWVARVISGEQDDWIGNPLTLPVLIFLGLASVAFVAGLAHASPTANTLRRFGEVVVSIGLVFVLPNCVRSRRQLEQIVAALGVAGFGAALAGVFFYVIPQELSIRLLSLLRVVRYPSGPSILRFINDDPERPLRAIGTAVDPNILGAMLILATALLAPQLFSPRPVIQRVFVAPMLAIMALCMILTFSRGSLLGLSFALLLLAAIRYRRWLPILVVVALLLLFLPQTQGYVGHFVAGIQVEDRATQMRFGEYKDALTLIGRYPWIGVGFSDAPDIDLYIGVSNVYLLIAEQMGLIGLLLFLAIVAAFFVVTWSARRHSSGDAGSEAILLGFQIGLAGALAGGIFDHYLFNLNFPHMSTIFWLFIGLGLVAARLIREPLAAAPLDTIRSRVGGPSS